MKNSNYSLGQLKKHFQSELNSIYSDHESASISKWTLQSLFNLSTVNWMLNENIQLEDSKVSLAKEKLELLLKGIPFQYAINEAHFLDLILFVDPSVLIPRPETEELVDHIIKAYPAVSKFKILDIGTGSGCIPIALKKAFPNSQITAIDISEDALKVAKRNAINNQVEIEFIQLDFLKDSDKLKANWDLIISNPPYILPTEKNKIPDSTFMNEPHTALFVENDPCLFYRKIASFAAKNNLSQNGQIYFELNDSHSKQIESSVISLGFKTSIWNDMQGKRRFLKANKLH